MIAEFMQFQRTAARLRLTMGGAVASTQALLLVPVYPCHAPVVADPRPGRLGTDGVAVAGALSGPRAPCGPSRLIRNAGQPDAMRSIPTVGTAMWYPHCRSAPGGDLS